MKISLLKLLSVAISTLLIVSLIESDQVAAAQEESCSFEMPNVFQSRYVELVHALKFPEIPQSSLYRQGITVDESILRSSDMATRKSHAIGESGCKDKSWIGGSFSFKADYVVNNPEPLPTELPEERRIHLIEKCREWGKTETETNEYLEKTLESYRKSKEKIVKGQIEICIVNTPSPKAAFEYLVVDASNCSLMDELIIIQFGDESKVSGLGTAGYCRGGIVRFIRDNIAVVIRGDGEFSREAMDIAQKIDAALLQQPLLTYEQLQARCPRLHIGPGKKTVETDIPFLEYSVESPAGVQAWARDIKINGQSRSRQDHKIYLEEKPQMVQVQAVIVSEELLVSTYEAEIEVPQ